MIMATDADFSKLCVVVMTTEEYGVITTYTYERPQSEFPAFGVTPSELEAYTSEFPDDAILTEEALVTFEDLKLLGFISESAVLLLRGVARNEEQMQEMSLGRRVVHMHVERGQHDGVPTLRVELAHKPYEELADTKGVDFSKLCTVVIKVKDSDVVKTITYERPAALLESEGLTPLATSDGVLTAEAMVIFKDMKRRGIVPVSASLFNIGVARNETQAQAMITDPRIVL